MPKTEDKALTDLLEDIDMDDFHYAIKHGRSRDIDNTEEIPDK